MIEDYVECCSECQYWDINHDDAAYGQGFCNHPTQERVMEPWEYCPAYRIVDE